MKKKNPKNELGLCKPNRKNINTKIFSLLQFWPKQSIKLFDPHHFNLL